MDMDWDGIDDMDDFSPIPANEYRCRIVDVEEKSTYSGDDMWNLKFEVIDACEYQGRNVYDKMIFSAKALKRVKFICSRLGINTTGHGQLTPDMLIGKECILDVEIDEYEADDGKKKKRNIVSFAGYRPVIKKNPDQKKMMIPNFHSVMNDDLPF